MKRTFSFILIFLLSLSFASAQSGSPILNKLTAAKATVSIVYSFGGTDLYNTKNTVGAPSYSGRGFYGFGALASMEVEKNLDIVTGISYIGNRFRMTPAPIGTYPASTNVNVNIFSVPLILRYHFLKFLYVGAGPVFNINSGDRDLNGIGLSGLFGAEYAFDNGLVVTFGPNIRFYGLLPWKNYRLINSGVNIGIGYRL